ncbi:MAG TPA: hypothetical protein VJ023_14485 [Pyrinomonadaceae bacterium]|nr:hypothetical protein [Pyrinomonadaceae bacterium]
MFCYNGINGRMTQKLIAALVIAALLQFVGFTPFVVVILVAAGLVVAYVLQRSANRETQRVFAFYIAAEEILRNDDRQWYAFEIAEVIDQGERVMSLVPDVPPVCQFAVGALCHRVGDYEAAVEYLAPVVQPESLSESRYATPSPQLRRYVELLRLIEREPARAPSTLGAVRSLERMRQKYAVQLLLESRNGLAGLATASTRTTNFPALSLDSSDSSLDPHIQRPISEVLQDVYPDEGKPS